MSKSRSLDDQLDESDAAEIVAEILAIKHKSKTLGYILNLDVEAICMDNRDPQDQLLSIIDEFLKTDPKPNWRIILCALRNPLIYNPHLIECIELKHCFPPSVQSGNGLFSAYLRNYLYFAFHEGSVSTSTPILMSLPMMGEFD